MGVFVKTYQNFQNTFLCNTSTQLLLNFWVILIVPAPLILTLLVCMQRKEGGECSGFYVGSPPG